MSYKSREHKVRKTNALTLIDGIIGAHTRDGPGKGVTVASSEEPVHSLLERFGVLIGATETTNGWKIHGESVAEALYFTRSYLECLYDFDSKFMNLPLKDQLSLFNTTRAWLESDFITFAKYATAWPMARWMRAADKSNDLPVRPEGFVGSPLLFKGSAKRFIKNRLISHQNKIVVLPWTILQGVKRAAAPAPKSYIHKTMVKHRTILTKQPVDDWAVRAEFDRQLVAALRGFRCRPLKLYEATTSASYESKRSEGGARQRLREDLGARPVGQVTPGGYEDDELLHMVETSPGHVQEVRGLPTPTIGEVVGRAHEESQDGPLKVMVSAVIEALKIRLITKGQRWSYLASKSYQKDLWQHLQTFPQFALTGRPMDKSDLYEILRQEEKTGLSSLEGLKWVSGDYSAATDNLQATFTRDAFETSLLESGLSWEEMDVLRSVIYNQELHYPEDMVERGGLDPIMQANGQLMGSTLSFPILCLVNLVAYAKSIHDFTGRWIPLRQLPVKINGDDILFRANDELYAVWQKNVKLVGFDLSVGKNYIHPHLLTVNSELYQMNKLESGVSFKKYEFFNIGLLTGQSKVTGRESGLRAQPVWDNYNQVLAGAVNPVRAHKRFIHYHKETIKTVTKNGDFNLFLPFERGGLGFVNHNVPYHITSFQRRFATVLESELREGLREGKIKPSALGVVSSDPASTGVRLKHNPTLKLTPRIGPVEQISSKYTPPEFKYPILSQVGVVDPPPLKFRIPQKRDKRLELVRTNTFTRMSTRRIEHWPYRVVEVPYTPEVVETLYKSAPTPMQDFME
jgi:hypothetical protein